MNVYSSVVARCGLLATLTAMLFASAAFAAGSSERVLYSFPMRVGETLPSGNLTVDATGNLYGPTFQGGTFLNGSVYQLLRPVPPSTSWTESELYSFTGGNDGGNPRAGLIFDQAGSLYGTTSAGGAFGLGTVFKLTPPAIAGGAWSETVLYSFQGGTNDGAIPLAGVVFDGSGNLSGTTSSGGISKAACSNGCGTVFKLTPPAAAGGAWTETVLHIFDFYVSGGLPMSTPIFDSAGNLYGTASGGGTQKNGVVWRLTPPLTSGGSWIYRVLHAFNGEAEGGTPVGSLILRGKRILYGTASSSFNNLGTVFQLVPPAVAGGVWTENTLHAFAGNSDGAYPEANLVFDSAGNIYGTTAYGGNGEFGCGQGAARGCGTVFELTPPASDGGGWTETVLHSFAGNEKDGFGVYSGLVLGKNGVLFGFTVAGGATDNGAVFGVVR